MNEVLKTRITGRAMRWVQLVHEYGHLSDEQLDALLVAVSDELGAPREQLVDLPEVRRIAAELLFERSPEGEDGVDVLAEDWPLLFY